MGERSIRILPGQYYDAETGTHYNYRRDYDPTIGRYVESDPIGLKGGVNTYAYVLSNPLRWFDAKGLQVEAPPRKPPVRPPDSGWRDGPCDLVDWYFGGREWDGPVLGWPPTVTIVCVYYCGPKFACPPKPEEYFRYIRMEATELIPGSIYGGFVCPRQL